MTMVINGSGTISGLIAGGLPDATITQPDLAAGVAGNGPAFSAYQSSSQSISQNTQTKVTLDTEDFDTNNNFASSRFTPTVAGYYQIQGNFKYASNTSTFLQSVANVTLYKNGIAYKGGTQNTLGGAAYTAFSVSCVVYLNGTTDYVELYTAHNYSSPINSQPADNGNTVHFSGALVRAA